MSKLTPLQIRELRKGDKVFIVFSNRKLGNWDEVKSVGKKYIKLTNRMFCAETGIEVNAVGSYIDVYFTEEAYKNSAKNSRYVDDVREAVRRELDSITLGQAHQLVKLFNLDIELHND